MRKGCTWIFDCIGGFEDVVREYGYYGHFYEKQEKLISDFHLGQPKGIRTKNTEAFINPLGRPPLMMT